MARRGGKYKMGDGEIGMDPGITGRKRGKPGIDPAYNTHIEDDVFSSDWNTSLNMYTPKDPMINPRLGGVLQPEKLGLPGNPLGIGGIDLEGKAAKKNAPNDAKEIENEGGEY